MSAICYGCIKDEFCKIKPKCEKLIKKNCGNCNEKQLNRTSYCCILINKEFCVNWSLNKRKNK